MKFAHWSLIGSLYVTQFLPVSFFFMGLPAILRAEGKSLEEIGALYLLGFVWVLKVFWAPLVDRVRLGRLGQYRGWLLVMQSAMIVLLLVIGLVDGLAQFPLVLALSALLTIFAATQDIAADALTCILLPPDQRGFGNGLQVGGGLVGLMLGSGATLYAYQYVGWMGCFVLMAAVLALALAQVLAFREPAMEHATAARPGYLRMFRFWGQKGLARWVVLMAVVPVGIGMVFGLISPMLVDIGWPVEQVGLLTNIAGSLVALVAVFATGWLIRKFGRRRMLIGATFVQSLVILALLPLARGAADPMLVVPRVLLVFLIYNPIATIMLTIMMDKVAKGSEGTDFTTQYSLYSFMGFFSGALALQAASSVGYETVVLVAAVLAVLAGILAVWLYRDAPARADAGVLRADPAPSH